MEAPSCVGCGERVSPSGSSPLGVGLEAQAPSLENFSYSDSVTEKTQYCNTNIALVFWRVIYCIKIRAP